MQKKEEMTIIHYQLILKKKMINLTYYKKELMREEDQLLFLKPNLRQNILTLLIFQMMLILQCLKIPYWKDKVKLKWKHFINQRQNSSQLFQQLKK